jgi:hypothetical protein
MFCVNSFSHVTGKDRFAFAVAVDPYLPAALGANGKGHWRFCCKHCRHASNWPFILIRIWHFLRMAFDFLINYGMAQNMEG